MGKDEIACEDIIHCPKCRGKLRKENGDIDSQKNLGTAGTDMYCDNCKDVMMTIFD